MVLYTKLNIGKHTFAKKSKNNLQFFMVILVYNRRMTKEEAVKKAGNAAKLAKLLGVTRGAVSHWVVLPKLRIYQLKELRPDWFAI